LVLYLLCLHAVVPRPSVSQPLVLVAWGPVYQSNKPACGGARQGNKKFDEYPVESIAQWHQRLGLES